MSGPGSGEPLEGTLATERSILANAKKLTLLVAGAASQKYMTALADQQEILGAIADMIIQTYAMDSAIVRSRKLIERNGESGAKYAIAMTQVYIAEAMATIEASAKKVLASVAEGDMLRSQMAILRRLAKYEPYNVIALRQQIADRVIEQGKYVI
jgi:hypothetical protein